MVASFRLHGQAMLDYLTGESGQFIFERDDGFRESSSVDVLFAGYRTWEDHERRAIRWARGRALDIGCGPGRVALYLERRGLAVTATDVSPEAVECARRRGVRDAHVQDAHRMDFPRNSFDTLVLFGNNFGICGDFAATRGFLRRARAITRRGGRLIASTRTPGSWLDAHAQYVKANIRRGRPPGLVLLRILYKGVVGSWFSPSVRGPGRRPTLVRGHRMGRRQGHCQSGAYCRFCVCGGVRRKRREVSEN